MDALQDTTNDPAAVALLEAQLASATAATTALAELEVKLPRLLEQDWVGPAADAHDAEWRRVRAQCSAAVDDGEALRAAIWRALP